MAKKPIVIKSVKLGKGVLSKDNKTPFAPGTFHYTSKDGWKCPADLSWKNLAICLNDPDVTEIQVIDENNVQVTITKEC